MSASEAHSEDLRSARKFMKNPRFAMNSWPDPSSGGMNAVGIFWRINICISIIGCLGMVMINTSSKGRVDTYNRTS